MFAEISQKKFMTKAFYESEGKSGNKITGSSIKVP